MTGADAKLLTREILLGFWKVHILHHAAEHPIIGQWVLSELRRCDLCVIGASTGGPPALQRILERLPARFPLPIVVVQHMPPSFTEAFAKRLDALCRLRVT